MRKRDAMKENRGRGGKAPHILLLNSMECLACSASRAKHRLADISSAQFT